MKEICFDVDKKMRLDEFLKEKHISRNLFLSLYKNNIFINEEHAKRNLKLENGDVVAICLEDEENNYNPIDMKIEILYEDSEIIIVDKPERLTMNKEDEENLANFVSYLFAERGIKQKVRFVNRLDMDTSGIVVIAKNKIAQAFYQKKSFHKKYLAIVKGHPQNQKIELNLERTGIKTEIKDAGKKSITIINKLKDLGDYSLIEAELLTGRTHQIRVSMQSINCPIIGDSLYGERLDGVFQLLHAYEIEFCDMNDKKHIVTTKLPKRFQKFLIK